MKNSTYEYDNSGNRIKATINSAVTDYTYTNGLLTRAGATTFTYYAGGSRETKAKGNDRWNYLYDQLGQLTQVKLNVSVK